MTHTIKFQRIIHTADGIKVSRGKPAHTLEAAKKGLAKSKTDAKGRYNPAKLRSHDIAKVVVTANGSRSITPLGITDPRI